MLSVRGSRWMGGEIHHNRQKEVVQCVRSNTYFVGGRRKGSVCDCVSGAGFIGGDNGGDCDCGEGIVCDWLINPRWG